MTGHLVHIGYPKAGSTFLQRWFERHPELDYRPGGLGGFGDVYHLAARAARTAAEPLWRVTSHESLSVPRADIGATRVDYGAFRDGGLSERQGKACRLLAELFPQAHILIVTRGFRSMILSSYSQYVRTGGTETLEALVAGGGESPWDYDRLIALYAAAFGAGRLIVLPYELLADRPHAFLGELEARLGIHHLPMPPERLNASLSPHELRWYPRIGRRLGAFGGRASRLHARVAFRNRLKLPIALLQRLAPAPPVTRDLVPDEALERFRGKAAALGANPLFAPYAEDYLL